MRSQLEKRVLKDFRRGAKASKRGESKSAAKKWEKRLSSEDFMRLQDAIWKPGPRVGYQTPDKWYKKTDCP